MNNNPIYFSIVEFQERIGYRNIHSVIHLDIPQGELSYQVYDWERNAPYKIIKSDKTNFKPTIFENESYKQNVIFNYGIKLSNTQKTELLKYCNALEFEPYRNKEMSMSDPGYIGYRDEVSIKFIGITNSYIPISGGVMLYNYLIEQYKEWNRHPSKVKTESGFTIEFNNKKLHLSKAHFPVYEEIADAIISHNIWKSTLEDYLADNPDFPNETINISDKISTYGFILALADTIEPIKRFGKSALRNIKMFSKDKKIYMKYDTEILKCQRLKETAFENWLPITVKYNERDKDIVEICTTYKFDKNIIFK